MAKLTDPLSKPREIPRLGGSVAIQPDVGTSDAGARGLQMLGHALGEGADDLYRAQKVEEERVNTMAAEDAFTKLRTQQLDLTDGETNGFKRQQGAAAVTKPILKEWSQRFDNAETAIAGGLTNDQQRQKFKVRADVSRLQYQDDLLRHLAQQSDTYSKEVYDGTVAVEQRNAVARWDSPNDIQLSLDRVKSAVEDRGERYVWPTEYKDGVMLQEQGKIHSAVVGQAIATGNYRYAEDWYNAHREDIDLGTAKHLEVAVRDGTQKELTAGYTADYLSAQNSPKALDALLSRLTADKTLDPTRLNVLAGRVQARMEMLDRRATAFQQHQEKQVEKAISTVNQNTLAGFEPTIEQMAPVLNAAKGTPQEAQAQQMVQLANATRQFRTSTPAQQEKDLAELEAGIRQDPTRFDIKTLEALRAINAAQKRQVQEDPIGFATKQGAVEPRPLDLTKPAEQADALQERFAIARSMRDTHQAPLKPLTPQEATLIGNALKRANPTEKRDYFAGLAEASGGDYEGYSAIMSQLAPDDPVTAMAGAYAGKKRMLASDLMLRGQAMLQPNRKEDGQPDKGKLWPMPPEKEMDEAFSSYEQGAFAGRPQLRSAFHQSAKAIYAALSADAGDGTAVFDSDRWEQSVKIATGGIEKYNGKAIVMPYGYEKGEFKDAVRRKTDQIMIRSEGAVTFGPEYDTTLTADQEKSFQAWKAKNAPKDSGFDYDLRGAYLEGLKPAANGHWPDTYKKPNHPTFSDQSKYAGFGTPGHWEGETFIPAKPGSKPSQQMSMAGRLAPSITADKLRAMPLEPIGDGRYVFRAGDGVLVDRAGKPVIMDFNDHDQAEVPETTVLSPSNNGPRPSEDVR